MRIIYFSQTFFSDCDFPLIRELLNKGIDVRYYMPLNEYNKKQALLDINTLKKRFGIFKASEYPEMQVYKDYINLDKVLFINIPNAKRGIYYKIFWKYVLLRMWLIRADVFHFTWQFRGREKQLGKLPIKRVLTVHDPISHSSVDNKQEELDRLESFRLTDRYILLSDVLANKFSIKYKIDSSLISIAKLGEFSHMRYIRTEKSEYSQSYILFFGQISSYKGIEYLCEAMVKIHDKHPDVSLIIAGKGDVYFDYSPYKDLNYIILKNEYLSVKDIANLLKHSLFSVCPYKDATQSGVVQTAFSCNTPMIVTSVGALHKAVQDGITGLVVPPSNSDALAAAIDKLLSNRELLHTFRENIDKIWRPSMDWNSIADKYIETWQKTQLSDFKTH